MRVTWLHISDFHLQANDHYDRDVVLRALVRSVERFRNEGRAPDVIFATGDIAYSGKQKEYEVATRFLDDLLKAAALDKTRLFIVAGNHDVDRAFGIGLARTLESGEEADNYFDPTTPKHHLTDKQGAFLQWYNDYFTGVRAIRNNSTCGPVEAVDIGGARLGILPINTALFCQDKPDQENLWVGRRCLDAALEQLKTCDPAVAVALMHHPLSWLHSEERSNIKSALHSRVDFVLRGHLHETEIEEVISPSGGVVNCAAGAAYQTRKYPNRAAYATIEGNYVTLFPIRYEDQPHEVWTVDPSLFPYEPGYQGSFAIPRLSRGAGEPRFGLVNVSSPMARFRSNVPLRHGPFVGREEMLVAVRERLGEPRSGAVLVLQGHSGAGKSELAREFARRYADRYPGGCFFVDAQSVEVPVDLAVIGRNILGIDFPPNASVKDQCLQTLYNLGNEPVLLIYDNVASADGIEAWLPPFGMACHVLITTVIERWDGWSALEVPPLSQDSSLQLIKEIGGEAVVTRYGEHLAELAGGLPVQLCPAAATLKHEERRGRLDSAQLTLTREASTSFHGVYERLDREARLLLHAAAFLNCRRIAREELFNHLEAAGWSERQYNSALDVCMDLHLLEGDSVLRMHQLLASFILDTAPELEALSTLNEVRLAQRRRIVESAERLLQSPGSSALAAGLMVFPLSPEDWARAGHDVPIEEGETVAGALLEVGRFEEARGWFERAVEAKQKGDVHGRVEHESLGISLHQVGYCLSSTGKFEEARGWFERAVEAAEKGDVHGRVDHESLGISLHQVGYCLSHTGKFEEARGWFERAVEAKRKGDLHGCVDRSSLAISLGEGARCLRELGRSDEAEPLEAEREGLES